MNYVGANLVHDLLAKISVIFFYKNFILIDQYSKKIAIVKASQNRVQFVRTFFNEIIGLYNTLRLVASHNKRDNLYVQNVNEINK